MESLIPLIIMAIVGAIASGKKKSTTPQKGEPKPFTATGRIPGDPVRKLQEMSKEMYRELQKEFQDVPSEPPSRQTENPHPPRQLKDPVIAAKSVEVLRSNLGTRETSSRESHRGRLSTHGAQKTVYSQVEQHDLIPKDGHDLLKGIVFAEILGPPKSKR